jgi:epoxyqueuosine reductase
MARYAWVRDYHRWMEKSVKALARWLREENGPEAGQFRYYVDTGPVLERDAATRAGLGWIGNHTNLLSTRFGNWLMLGVILTDLPLPPDEPAGNHCGTCSRCIDACPTQAITAPYRLDARRCISYLTIEHRGWIPIEFRAAIGNRIFGCDICLEVCPWNRFAKAAALEGVESRDEWRNPKPLDWLKLTEPEFRELFRGHPVLRTKREGLLRNCCVVLGNSGSIDAVPGLADCLLDSGESPMVRGHAAWALARIGGPEARLALDEARRRLAGVQPEDEDHGRLRLELGLGGRALGH